MPAGPEADGESDEDEWRFSLEEIDSMQENGEKAAVDDTEEGGNVAGSLEHQEPLEPGDINLENAIFVALGALLVLGLIAAAFLGI